jgi:hypothetical protein
MAYTSPEGYPRQTGPGYPNGVLFNVGSHYPHLTPSRDDPTNLRSRSVKGGGRTQAQVRTGLDRATFRALVRSRNAVREYRREGRARRCST